MVDRLKKQKNLKTLTATFVALTTLICPTLLANGYYNIGNMIPRTIPCHGSAQYTTAGSFTFVAPCTSASVLVQVWGAGGSGAGGGTSGSGGGGGGAYAAATVSITNGSSYSVVVGAGGLPNYNNGSDGGISYFVTSTNVAAAGGSGGPYSGNALGGSAAASFGATVYSGGNGYSFGSIGGGGGAAGPNGAGVSASSTIAYNGGAGDNGLGGAAGTGGNNGGGTCPPTPGASNPLGGGGGAGDLQCGSNAGNGGAPGGGSGGSYNDSSATAAPGQVLLTW